MSLPARKQSRDAAVLGGMRARVYRLEKGGIAKFTRSKITNITGKIMAIYSIAGIVRRTRMQCIIIYEYS